MCAATIAVPLSGFVGADSSIAMPMRALGTATATSTWADVGTSSIGESMALAGSDTAASRARVRAPLTTRTCLPATEGADGARRMEVKSETIYWPIAEGRFQITSPFGSRVSPISGQLLMHEGIDMSAPLDTPLHAVYSGTVVEVSENSRSGALVKIKHTRDDGTVFYSAYLHQYMNKILVKEGQEVTVGQQIGHVGSNGWSTGPHLHFEIHDASDKPIDPQTWMTNEKAIYIGQESCS